MNRYRKLLENTVVFTISEFASKFLMFFMLPLYTSYMSSSDFGISDLINSSIQLLIPIFTLSIFSSVMRFSLEKNYNKEHIFNFGIKITLLGSVGLFLISCPILIKLESFYEYLILFYLIYIINSIDLLLGHFARGLLKIRLVGIAGIMKTVIIVTLNVILLGRYRMGVLGYLISYIIAMLISCIFLALTLRVWKYISYEKVDKKLKIEMIKYSIPLIPNSVSWWMNSSANKYIITFFSGSSGLGLFSAASRIPTILTTLQSIFSQALVISIIEEYDAKDYKEYYKELYEIYHVIMSISTFILIALTKVLARFLLANEFFMSWEYVTFLLVATLFGAMSGFLGTFYSATKKTKGLFTTTLIGGVISIAMNFILIPYVGIIGASVSTVISYFVVWALRVFDTSRLIKLNFDLRKHISIYILLLLQAFIVIKFTSFIILVLFELCIALVIITLSVNELKIIYKKMREFIKSTSIGKKH